MAAEPFSSEARSHMTWAGRTAGPRGHARGAVGSLASASADAAQEVSAAMSSVVEQVNAVLTWGRCTVMCSI